VRWRGADPETQHERDIREQSKGVPVADRFAQPGDSITVRIQRRHGLGQQRPHEHGADGRRERPRGEPRSMRTADGGKDDPEAQERRIRDALVERVPTPIGDDRPPDRGSRPRDEKDERPDQCGTGAADSERGHPSERRRDERTGEEQNRGGADRKDPVDARAVAGEHRSREDDTEERGEDDSADSGGPVGGLRSLIHDAPR
jgi:hypothetical protein